jgi:hypothetical protein
MTGVRFITDEKGQKTDLVISIKDHEDIVEDLLDALLVEERKNEETIPFKKFLEQLKAEGLLDE